MNIASRYAHDIAASSWVIIIFGFAGLASFVWLLYDKLSANPSILSNLSLAGALIVFFGAFFYSFRVRQENSALRDMAKWIHKINHDYRDVLRDMFSKGATEISQEHLASAEAETIKSCTAPRLSSCI